MTDNDSLLCIGGKARMPRVAPAHIQDISICNSSLERVAQYARDEQVQVHSSPYTMYVDRLHDCGPASRR